jgi:3',5'-cyclic AMP phosphodiesterase CpdA
MRKLVHISDLHFGRVDKATLQPLRAAIARIAPHLVVVSGDLTQRATPGQFREAKAFLDTLPKPQIVVPGNHDVPLFNVFQRLFTPLGKFKRIIGPDVEPEYIDDEIAVMGINTARSLVWKGGRINTEQVERVRSRICNLAESITKIIVTHHPFDVPAGHKESEVVQKAERAIKTLAGCGADVMLAGHLHKSNTTASSERYKLQHHIALLVQAGTATSTRGRGEKNSFNALRVTPDEINIERWVFNDASAVFELGPSERFMHADDGWHRPK